MKFALCLVAIAASMMAATVEETIKANIDKFAVAVKAGDEKVLNTLLGDDLVYVHSNTKSETKAEAVAALVKGKADYNHTDIKVKAYGNTAVARMNIHVMPNDTKINVLQVWVKNGANWQMVQRQATRFP